MQAPADRPCAQGADGPERPSDPADDVTIVRFEHAMANACRRTTVMAHALATFVAGVPATRAWIWPVDRHGHPSAQFVLLTSGAQPRTAEDAGREYRRRYWYDDPFSPHRFLDRGRRVVTLADVGGARALASTAYGREFLPESRMAHRVMVCLRAEGRLVAVATLLRTADERDFGEREVAFLHRVQPLASMAYALSAERRTVIERDGMLEACGVSARQAEVARMASGGATNAEIARALMISPETVKRHLSTVYSRLDIRSRTELACRLG